jgi:hypothetical protein
MAIQRYVQLKLIIYNIYRLDDPLIWGMLPMRYFFDAVNMRWGLGAHDICFKNK